MRICGAKNSGLRVIFMNQSANITGDAIKFYIERQQGKHWVAEDFDFYENKKQMTGKHAAFKKTAKFGGLSLTPPPVVTVASNATVLTGGSLQLRKCGRGCK
jgi:hypothetical protein